MGLYNNCYSPFFVKINLLDKFHNNHQGFSLIYLLSEHSYLQFKSAQAINALNTYINVRICSIFKTTKCLYPKGEF